MTDSWIIKPIQLKYLMGEVRLFSLMFSFLVLDTHFTKLTTNPDEPHPPFEEYPSTVQGALIRSHPIKEELPRLSWLSNSIRYVPTQYERYYIDLQGSFADYLKNFSSKSRSTLRRKVRKFAEFSGGEVCWREFRNCEEMEEFYRLAREVSKNTYQEKLLDAGLPTSKEFKRQIFDLVSSGLVRGYLLFYGERPIAYLYCPITEGILLYEYLGYDSGFQRWSPGTVLQYLVLEKLFAEGEFRMFDFTEGEGQHKKLFATGSIRCADIYYFRPTARNLSLLVIHSGMHVLSRSMVKVLNLLRVKVIMKKLIRSKA